MSNQFTHKILLSLVFSLYACEPIDNSPQTDEFEIQDSSINIEEVLSDAALLVDNDQEVTGYDFYLLDQGLLDDQTVDNDLDQELSDNDMLIDQELAPWLGSSCETQASPLLLNEIELSDLSKKHSISTGQALGRQKLLIHQASESEQSKEYLSLVGNLLSLRDKRGLIIWERNTSGVSHLHGLYDFNGDGTLEILANSLQRVHIYNLATGTELWRSEPEDLEVEQALTSVHSVKVSQAFDELFPYLYLSDAGCSTAGTGYGIIYRFDDGFQDVQRQVISGPRQAGRCAKWHTLRRKDNFSQTDDLYVLLTDQKGLHGFSASSGQRILCGNYGQDLVAGELPYKSLNNEEVWSWISILNGQVSYLGLRDYQAEDQHCESAQDIIAPLWQRNLPNATPKGLINIDLNADRYDEIWVNHYSDPAESMSETQWMTSIIDGRTGQVLATLSNMAVLSHLSWSVNAQGESLVDILVSLNPSSAWAPGEVVSDVEVIRVNLEQFNQASQQDSPFSLAFDRIWNEPLSSVLPVWHKASSTDTPEFLRLLKVNHAQDPHLIFRRSLNQEGFNNQEQLISVSASGVQYELGSEYSWAYVGAICLQDQECDYSEQIQAVESNGAISILDHRLNRIAPEPEVSLEFVTGSNAFELYHAQDASNTRLVTLSEAGQLSAFSIDQLELSQTQPSPLWKHSVSALAHPQELGPHKPFITSGPNPKVIACQRRNPTQSTWLAFDLESGVEIWRHTLNSALWYSEKQYFAHKVRHAQQEQELVFRVERALEQASIDSLSPCEGEEYLYSHSNLFMPSLSCPQLATTPRVIHALDAHTGSCVWRAIIQENNPCSRPSLQNLSLLDLNQDGNDELYYLESDTLRVLNPITGELLESQTIPQRPDQRLVSGGWLKGFQGGLLRYGTFSPPDLYQAPNQSILEYPLSPLEPLWLGANIAGIRNQSWLRSWVAISDNGIWTRLGLERPLVRYNNQGEIDQILRLSVNYLSQREPNLNSFSVERLNQDELLSSSPNITGLTETDEGGLIASTNEAAIFVLDTEGALQWGRQFVANPSLPMFSDWDADGQQEWIIATANGEIQLYDQESYQGITEVWESSCDQVALCSSEEDIDQVILGQSLCIAWIPLQNTNSVLIQLQTQSGTAISEWLEPDLVDRFVINEPNLVADNEYRIAIKARVLGEEGQAIDTAISHSDGFMAIDDSPPNVILNLDREQIMLDEVNIQPLQIEITASDTVRLAGWSLLVYSEQNQLVKIIASSASNQQELSERYTWHAQDRYGAQVEPGRFKVSFIVSDDAGQQSVAEAWVDVE